MVRWLKPPKCARRIPASDKKRRVLLQGAHRGRVLLRKVGEDHVHLCDDCPHLMEPGFALEAHLIKPPCSLLVAHIANAGMPRAETASLAIVAQRVVLAVHEEL